MHKVFQPPYDPKAVAADIAAELRADPKAFTQRSYGRNVEGEAGLSSDPGMVCWCLTGHIHKRTPGGITFGEGMMSRRVVTVAFTEIGLGVPFDPGVDELPLVAWSDKPGRTVAEVIALCDKVAA